MKHIVFLSVLFFFSCEPIEKNEDLQISKSDIVGSWKQIDTSFVLSTNPETAVTTEYKFNELYTFTNDDQFDVRDKSLFVFCDRGGYVLDTNTKQIDFTCDLVEVEIGGSPVILESNTKKMKWNIVDMIEDTLHVDVQYYDKISETYGNLIRRRYLKQ